MAAKSGTAEVVIKFKSVGDRQIKQAIEQVSKATVKAQKDAERASAAAARKAEADAKREANERTREAERSLKVIERNKRRHAQWQRAELQKASREETRAAAQTAREVQRLARETERVEKRAAENAAKAAEAADKRKAASAARMRRSLVKETQRAYRETERAAREAEMAQRRSTQRFRRGLATAAVATGAVVSAGIGASQRAQGVLGIRSQEEILQSAIQSRANFIRTSSGAGLSAADRALVSQGAINIGRNTGLGPQAIFDMIGTNQELFSGLADARASGTLPAFMESIEKQARFARATGANATDVVTLRGEAMRQLSLSAQEADDALALFAQGAQDGSLNVADFASSFSEIMSPFSLLRGNQGTGLGAVREFQALGQALKAGGQSAEGARTLQSNMFAAFQSEETRAAMARAGVDVMESDGQGGQRLRNTASIIAQMARDEDFQGVNLGSIVRDRQARDAIQILMAQEQRAMRGEAGSMSLAERQQVSTIEAGRGLVDRTFAALDADPSGQAARMAANREAAIFESQDRLTRAALEVAGPLTELQDEFPLLTAALEELTPILQGVLAFAFARAVLPGTFMSNLGPTTGPGAMANLAAAGGGVAPAVAPAATSSLAAANATASAALVGSLQLAMAAYVGANIGLWVSDHLPGGEERAKDRQWASRDMERSGGFFATIRDAWRNTNILGDTSRFGGGDFAGKDQAAAQNRVEAMARRREEEAGMTRQTNALSAKLDAVVAAIERSGNPSGSPGNTTANGQSQ